MKRRVLTIVLLALFCAVTVWAQQRIAISGKQIRGVPGRNAELISKGVTLSGNATIVEVNCGGDGFWIEDDMGVVMEYPKAQDAVGKPLDAGGPYRVYPFLKDGQAETSVSIVVTVP